MYEKLKLIASQRNIYFLTNLGLLFSQHKNSYFPYAKIECARFKGTTTKVFIDQASYDADIIESIEFTMEFIQRNIRLGATIGEIYRENRWEYPLLAIREVLINAVVHRNYAVTGSDIKVAIYDDMVEITSPGVLNIDKQKLGYGYSELRNPHFGLLFKKLKLIEQWGTGFEKIYQSLNDYPQIKLNVDDDSSFVQIQFVKKQKTADTTQETANTTQKAAATTQETASTTQETTNTTQENASATQKSADTTRETADTIQEQDNIKKLLLKLLKENGSLTRKELATKLNTSENNIKYHLSNLKKQGVIKRQGSTKSGFWIV